MTLICVADGDRMHHDIFVAKPIHSRAPAIEVVFTVRENHDGPALGMFLRAKRFTGRIQGRAEVCTSRSNPAGPEPMQCVEHRAQVLSQRTTKHAPAGECHHGRTVRRLAGQGVYQALRRLDRYGQSIGHRIFDPHAPAHVDQQHHVMPRRNRRRGEMTPPWLCQGENQACGTRNQQPRTILWRAATLRESLPAPHAPRQPRIAQRADPGTSIRSQSNSG